MNSVAPVRPGQPRPAAACSLRRRPAAAPPRRGDWPRRARPVGGQRQLRGQPGQRLPPVGELPRQQAARVVRVAQQLPLPQRVVGVLHRQRRPAGAGPPRRAAYARRRSPRQHARSTSRQWRCDAAPAPARARPAPARTAGPAPAARRPGRTAGRARRRAAPASSPRRPVGHRQPGRRPPPRSRICWQGYAVGVGEHGAQHLVPGHDIAPAPPPARPASSSPVSRTRQRHVVGPRRLPSSWSRNHSRCCANDSGSRSGRGPRAPAPAGRPRPSLGEPRPARPGSAPRTGRRMVSSAPSTARIRAISRMASSEWPPRSKKLSSSPTRSRPSTSANSRAQRSPPRACAGSRPAGRAGVVGARAAPRRSSFPLGSAAARPAPPTPPAPCTPAAAARAHAPAAAGGRLRRRRRRRPGTT